MNKEYFNKIKKLAAEEYNYMLSIRRDIHAHPETGLNEFRTAQLIEDQLRSISAFQKRIGTTGLLGIIKGKKPQKDKEKVIVLRADIDALPICEKNDIPYKSQNQGIMHACGHDVHTASLLGAAKIINELRDFFSGEVRLIFQPAEEIGKGSRDFILQGILNNADRVFGLHCAPEFPCGTIITKEGLNNAAVDQFKIKITGKSSHVSCPQMGVDALYIASQLVVSIQSIVTRMTSPVNPVVIGVGKFNSGTTYNALAENAELEGTIRTVTEETRTFVKERLNSLVQKTAAIYGAQAEIQWEDFCPVLFNNPSVTREVKETVDSLFGPGHSCSQRPLSLGGDNFADFIQTVPGMYAYVGSSYQGQEDTAFPLHNGHFNVDEKVLIYASGIYAAYALYFLTEDKKIKES